MAFPTSAFQSALSGAGPGAQMALPCMSPAAMSMGSGRPLYMTAPPSPYSAGHPRPFPMPGHPMGGAGGGGGGGNQGGRPRLLTSAGHPGMHGGYEAEAAFGERQPFHSAPPTPRMSYGQQQQQHMRPMQGGQMKPFVGAGRSQSMDSPGYPCLNSHRSPFAGNPGCGRPHEAAGYYGPDEGVDHILEMDPNTAEYVMAEGFPSGKRDMPMGLQPEMGGMYPPHQMQPHPGMIQGHVSGYEQGDVEVQQEINMNIKMRINGRRSGGGGHSMHGFGMGSGLGEMPRAGPRLDPASGYPNRHSSEMPGMQGYGRGGPYPRY